MLAPHLLALLLLTDGGQAPPAAEEMVVVTGDPSEAPTPAPPPRPRPRPSKTPKPSIELRCTPPIRIGSFLGGALFTAELRVRNPGERLWSPGIVWRVNGEKVSEHEADSKPYDEVVAEREGEEPEVWSEPPKLFRLGPGEHEIEARLVHAGKEVGRDSCRVYSR